MVAAGNLGLAEALRRFNPEQGASFSTYARHRIRGAITDSLRCLDPLSRHLRSRHKAADHAFMRLTAALSRAPSDAEIAGYLQCSEESWQMLKRQLHEAGSPVYTGARERAATPVEHLAATGVDPEHHAQLAQARERLVVAVGALPPKHRAVIRLYHFEGRTMKEIAKSFGVNESRVSQIRHAALRKLRMQLEPSQCLPGSG